MVQARRASHGDLAEQLREFRRPSLGSPPASPPASQHHRSNSSGSLSRSPSSPREKSELQRDASSASITSRISNAWSRVMLRAAHMFVTFHWYVVKPSAIALIPTVCAVIMKWYQ